MSFVYQRLRALTRSSKRLLGLFVICASLLTSFGAIQHWVETPAQPAQAANDFSMKTGYYLGMGSPMSVTGLGFTPEAVIIKADTAAGSAVWKSSAMPSNVTAYLGVATADNTESQIMLDADGFSLSVALEVNTINVRYTYIAFAGSDCTSGGAMCVSTYTGNIATSQAIVTGFQPDFVMVKRSTALAASFRTSSMAVNHAGFFSAVVNDTTGVFFQTLNVDGFTVGATNNTNGGVYYYLAFKNLAGKFAVGQFTGDGVDNRNISGLGFEPDAVFLKQNSANALVYNTTETWGDYSHLSTASANAVNHIQELQADGFQVGNSVNVNATGIISDYFAFGGAPDPAGAGSFFMERGSYTGNGTTQSITTSFAPDLVIIKGDTTQYAVYSTSLNSNLTHYFALSAVGFLDGITAMGTTDFTVGANTTVNTNAINYEWIAFGNATSPLTGDGASDFMIGAHTGNGITARAFDHLGMDPDLVTIKRTITTAALANWRSTTMAGNVAAYYSATADSVDGSIFQTLDATGFTTGLGATSNAAAGAYIWFAFKEGANVDVGSYAGNGVAATDITGLGFSPDWVWTKRSTAVRGVHRSSSSTITGANAQHFLNVSNEANHITAFVVNGFTVGSSTEVNAAGGAYQYASFNASTSDAAPNTPTNTAPANGAITQDLNTTLSASAYVDADLNAHLDTQWQVDDDSTFASPVWTRLSGAAETSTSITSGNGTFANELSGKTELNHNSVYYWRVRYSDGVWSHWSTSTSYTTNIIVTPTNTTPADGATVTTLTPTLMANAFSDQQGAHTAASAQWQLNSNSIFTSPYYDSGTVAYSTAHAVPAAILADRNTYYWRVRYADSSGQWSEYSSATRFVVSESIVNVRPLFGSTVIDQGDSIYIDALVELTNGTVINDATVTINIYNPAGTLIVSGATMSYFAGSSGVYRYSFTVPALSGSYLYEVTAVSNSKTGYGAANFEARTIAADVTSIKSTVESEETAQIAERAAQAAERVAQATSRSNIDVLVGAMIMTQSAVNDVAGTATAFVTDLTNPADDFYNNAVLTFTTGALNGQVRRIADYNGTTKLITVDPALASAPADNDEFTIVKQNVYVEEQLAEHETAEATFRADTTSRLTDIEDKIDDLTTTLNGVDTDLSAVQTTVNNIRSSQQKLYTATLSDVGDIQAGNTYRVTLTLLDYESNPVNASATPTLVIYDALRAVAQASTNMTALSTGVYEYTFAVAPAAVTGLWETIVNVDVGGTADIIRNDYWSVTGAPAQVIIHSMADVTVPTIAADVTITNEGGGPFEYQYEWCVVANQDNQCGGGDDVYYASAAKLINAGDDYDTILTANVPTPGAYYFKLVVYFGTESSGASMSFTATADTGTPTPVPNIGGGTNLPNPAQPGVDQITLADELARARAQLTANALQLEQVLSGVGLLHPNILKLLSITTEDLAVDHDQSKELIEIQNLIADLRAVSSATRRVVEQRTVQPIVETYMKFGSVEIHFLITNPDEVEQVVKFKAFLPEEVRPEHVLDLNGLNIDYDPNAGVYFVSGDITLQGKESITKFVKMQDIWVFEEKELQSMKDQAALLLPAIEKTQYGAQGVILKSEIDSALNIILLRQEESYSSPQDHILAYRENKERLARVNINLDKLKDLVVQAGASQGVVGEIGGIQTFSTWGIVVAIVFCFGLLIILLFAMWRHQTMLSAVAQHIKKEQSIKTKTHAKK